MDRKKYLFQLNHPAHFHLFKNTISALEDRGHSVLISIKNKDILKELVKDYKFIQLSDGYRKNNIFSIINSVYQRDKKLLKLVKNYRPTLMIGTSPEIGHISFITKYPSLFLGEDDINYSFMMYVGALSCYPFFSHILAPNNVHNGFWNRKTTFYYGYHKLAYLHPKRFTPDKSVLNSYIDSNRKYFIIRLAKLNAYHDVQAKGINENILSTLIKILDPLGDIYITSERELEPEFEKFRLRINAKDIHHFLAFADLYIGDSQSMAVESAMLGTPSIRFSSFVGKISVLEELEQKYKLTFGVKDSQPEKLYNLLEKLVSQKDLKKEFQSRREKMLADKIDVTAFLVWFIENYPFSRIEMQNNPDIQKKFK